MSATNISPAVFLSLLTAFLPQGQYSTEVGRWTDVVKALRDRHEKEHPGLFLGFSIYEYPSKPSYSPEVDRWLTHLYAEEDLKPAVGAPDGPISIAAEGRMWFKFPPSFQRMLEKAQDMQRPRLKEVILIIQQFAKEVAQEGLLVP